MKKYEVIVDYVMTATLVVEARDAASAENKAWRFVHSKKGFDEYVRIAAPANVLFGKRMWMGDGFDIPGEAVELVPEDRLGSRSCIDLTQGGF